MFNPIPNSLIEVGKALKKEIFSLIKTNFDDIETRLSAIESISGASLNVLNGDVDLKFFDINNNDFFYYKAPVGFNITSFQFQLFSKQDIITGDLEVDIQKANDTDPANFVSILTTPATADFSTASDYDVISGDIDGSLNSIGINQVLRIVILSKPTNFFGKILVRVGAI